MKAMPFSSMFCGLLVNILPPSRTRGTNREILLIDHLVQEGDLAVGIGDNWELDLSVADLVNVLDPLAVGAEIIGTLE